MQKIDNEGAGRFSRVEAHNIEQVSIMSLNNYKNIKKYAAFLFMVFTVLSGSSDNIDSDSYIRAGRKAFIDIFASNMFFAQDIRELSGQMQRGSTIRINQVFREYLDNFAENSHLNDIKVYIIPLAVFVFYINNLISKNNIWKSAVF